MKERFGLRAQNISKHYNRRDRILTKITGLVDGIESVLKITEEELPCFQVVVSITAYRFVRHDHSSLPGIPDVPTPPEWLLKEREWVTVNTMSSARQNNKHSETTFSNQHRLKWSFP